jgi:hypothetical protein
MSYYPRFVFTWTVCFVNYEIAALAVLSVVFSPADDLSLLSPTPNGIH